MHRALDILGVYVLPICCFIADYATGYLGTSLYPLTLWTFGAAGMSAFAVSRRGMARAAAANITVGALLVAATGAGLIAVPLYFVGVVGVTALLATRDPVFAAALLAFVPILTAERLARRARAVRRTVPFSAAAMVVGVAAVIVPTCLAFAFESWGDQRREADLRSGERERVLRALSPESWYGPRDIVGRPSWSYTSICRNLSTLPLEDPAVESAARKALRTEPEKTVHEDCGKAR